MNYELIMLRRFQRMRKLSRDLSSEAEMLAVMSYGYEFSCCGTQKQIEQICQKMQAAKACSLFCQAVCDGLNKLNKSDRALLVCVYVKRVKINYVAARLRVSVATVYRRLLQSRSNFKKQLKSLGCDEKWFAANFPHFDFTFGCSG